MSCAELAAWLAEVARGLPWRVYQKRKRGPKKPPPKKKKGGWRRPHVSTARLLQERHQNPQ